jgi:hypothetical protein
MTSATATVPARIFITGNPELEGEPIQFGNATFEIWIMTSITIIPEIIGARRKRTNRPMKPSRRTGSVSAHQIKEATKKDPYAAPRPPFCKCPTEINAAKLPA